MGKAGTSVLTITAKTDRWTLGVAGVTRSGSHMEKHGRPLQMSRSIGTSDGYKGNRNFIGSVRESELPIVPIIFQGQHNLERGKGQCLHQVSKGGKEGRLQC